MKKLFLLLLIGTCTLSLFAQREQRKKEDQKEMQKEGAPKSALSDYSFSALKLRNIGPAFTSGRIADIAIHPNDENTWYVAVGSGGVWKTDNSGITWSPIFDDQGSYSIGCVTIDHYNPNIIWVGTGENVGGRHVGYGDGIYRSTDGGKSWKNMGLKNSEHLSKIIVHPANSDIIWVASQGPLWSEGGDRGFYKSVDGGATWKKTLGDEKWTGVTDIAIDPRDPNRLYAATWQRHRTIAAHMGGGPESGLHRSLDGGDTWERLTSGLPRGNMGKIGLAISTQNPDVLYAAIELDRTTGAVYKSTDRGASWSKQSDAVSGGTGPHYYQELYACPHVFDRLYLCDVRIQVSDDGGKTFRQLQERNKHSDNHAIAFRKDDPDYLLVGSDGGIYESYDLASNWRFIDNLPVTQYYKVAVDDRLPFYHIYGGTQDNGSHGGPSRTDKGGIKNSDWYVTLGADGHQSATEPGNPNIMYAETQEGGLHRVDRLTMEQVYIQPQPRAGEDAERYNWDAPIIVSPHKPSRIYFASQRVWKSENRGDSWTPISGDLTRNQSRLALPIMGKTQSWDSPWDLKAMSNFNTISSLAESPLKEGLIYAGTDDGFVQVTEDGGVNWRKIEITTMPGVPATAFVNDIRADLHDVNTVYVALDNHKHGDFNPYLYKSTDRGKTWTSIKGNIPDRTLIWRTVQDHVKPNLLFAATEFGVYFTLDGGTQWVKLKGAPTISFRDLTIQRRENDLVCASFGRGFFVLDDYSALREITEEIVQKEGHLFAARPASWYAQSFGGGGSNGADEYSAPNPPFGAMFTYHLKDEIKSLKSQRQEKEKELAKENKDIPFPGWDALEAERRQQKPMVWLSVKDAEGNVIRRVEGATGKGLNRVTWDLRYQSKSPVDPDAQSTTSESPFQAFRRGSGMAVPGTYSVSLLREVEGQVTTLAGPMQFEIKPLRAGALEGKSYAEINAFREAIDELSASVSAANIILRESTERVRAMRTALSRTDIDSPDLTKQLFTLNNTLMDLDIKMNGDKARAEIGELQQPTLDDRMGTARRGLSTTYGPTAMHVENLDIAKSMLKEIEGSLNAITNAEIPKLERALQAAGAPWIVGQALPPRS